MPELPGSRERIFGQSVVEFGNMPKQGLAHERSSHLSRALIICFSVAIVIMGGWLAMMIMVPSAPTSADPNESAEVGTVTGSVPRVENTATSYEAPLAAQMRSSVDAPPWPDSSPSNPFSTPSGGATLALSPNEAGYGLGADAAQTEPGADLAEVVPLPTPRPRRVAVPVPRPRPRIEEAEVEAKPHTLLDLLVGLVGR
jgi:hypothetical protein